MYQFHGNSREFLVVLIPFSCVKCVTSKKSSNGWHTLDYIEEWSMCKKKSWRKWSFTGLGKKREGEKASLVDPEQRMKLCSFLNFLRSWRGPEEWEQCSLWGKYSMFNRLVFMFSVLDVSPFFLWSSRPTLGRIMPELLGSTPLSTVLQCFVVCITLLRITWLLLHWLHLVLACS